MTNEPERSNDLIEGGADADALYGSAEGDLLYGDTQGTAQDFITQGATQLGSGLQGEWVDAENGDDQIFTTDGRDLIAGGDGADLIVSGGGDDYIAGDWNTYSLGSVAWRDWTVTERIETGPDGIPVHHYDITNIYTEDNSGTGNDLIPHSLMLAEDKNLFEVYAGAGNDIVLGERGNDTLYLEAGDDKAWGGEGADIILGDAGNDLLSGGAGADTLFGGIGNDKLGGDSGTGIGDGNDYLDGQAGDDISVLLNQHRGQSNTNAVWQNGRVHQAMNDAEYEIQLQGVA